MQSREVRGPCVLESERGEIRLDGPQSRVSRISFSFIGILEQVLRRNGRADRSPKDECDTVKGWRPSRGRMTGGVDWPCVGGMAGRAQVHSMFMDQGAVPRRGRERQALPVGWA